MPSSGTLSNINLNIAIIQIPMCRQQMFLRWFILKEAKEKRYFFFNHWKSMEPVYWHSRAHSNDRCLQGSPWGLASLWKNRRIKLCLVATWNVFYRPLSEDWYFMQYPVGGGTEPRESPVCQSSREVAQSYPTLCDPMDLHQVPLSMGFSRQEY